MIRNDLLDGHITSLENRLVVQKRVIERRESGRVWTLSNDRNAGVAALAHDRRTLERNVSDLARLQADRRSTATS